MKASLKIAGGAELRRKHSGLVPQHPSPEAEGLEACGSRGRHSATSGSPHTAAQATDLRAVLAHLALF